MSWRRSSCMILPGSSPDASSSWVPWRRASVRSVPSATPVPSGNIIRAAQMLSRPNSVRNHGTPAAMNTPSGVDSSVRRNDARSSSAWSTRRPSRGSAASMLGRTQSAGVRAARSSGAWSRTWADQRSVISSSVRSSTCQRTVAVSGSTVARSAATVTVTPASDQTRRLMTVPASPRSGRMALAGRVRPARAQSMGVRSQFKRTATVSRTGAAAVERTRIVSSIPSAGRYGSDRAVRSGRESDRRHGAARRRTSSRRVRVTPSQCVDLGPGHVIVAWRSTRVSPT